jgi:hypothetical protein
MQLLIATNFLSSTGDDFTVVALKSIPIVVDLVERYRRLSVEHDSTKSERGEDSGRVNLHTR